MRRPARTPVPLTLDAYLYAPPHLINVMSDVKAIENAVKSLPPQEFAEFRNWFAEFDTAAWDRQIELDLAAGKLDGVLSEAHADYRGGPGREF